MDEPATLFFSCTLGADAVLRYGDRSQPCPSTGSLLGIELAEPVGALRLSVQAAVGTEWELSIEGKNLAPLPSPVPG